MLIAVTKIELKPFRFDLGNKSLSLTKRSTYEEFGKSFANGTKESAKKIRG